MRRLGLILFVIFPAILVTGCSKPHQYDSSAGKYTVEFPGKPTEQTQSALTPVGSITVNIAVYESRNGSYAVMYNDYPASHIQSNSPDVLLEGACQGAVSNNNGRIVSQESISINNHPGREIKVSASHGGKQIEAKNRIYLVGNRLYQVIVTAAPGDTEDSTADKFFNSFKLN